MPELPEVECVRRSLDELVVGRRVARVTVHRRDVITAPTRRIRQADLLAGATIDVTMRHGKQLVFGVRGGPLVCVHLGMSGQLIHREHGQALEQTDHVHVTWRLQRPGHAESRLVFRDPRRFGGLWLMTTERQLVDTRWCRLGPDALTISTQELAERLVRPRRAVKDALLDQSILAGVGNIYADEALFLAGVCPLTRASDLERPEVRRLTRAVRQVLHAGIRAGGSTLRDYVDPAGRRGTHQKAHAVYGRGGSPCLQCRTTLVRISIAQRTTVYCPKCQPRHD